MSHSTARRQREIVNIEVSVHIMIKWVQMVKKLGLKIKLEPMDQGTAELRTARDDLNGTSEISDDEFDPLVNLYPGPSNAADTTGQEEEGITW